ncbi:capsular biosynthesis protein [Halomonas sp. 86]|uniref:capsular biosynthesis protein n=1 Tax=unclassified Halomonas TaxID=2609666 RepID=UPI004033BC6B
MKSLVIDIDDTLSFKKEDGYENALVNYPLLEKLNLYRQSGFRIILYTSRNMRTFASNIGEITAHTLPVLVTWLDKNEIPYDEIHIGKPWCGYEGFYVDDKAVRPDEFVNLSYEELRALTSKPNDSD